MVYVVLFGIYAATFYVGMASDFLPEN